ncbi:hypothetical protein EDD11_001997 [Mortierella claussenii]|nr:hypothetical protein EDD11_001997 [Mortierella claussenii]
MMQPHPHPAMVEQLLMQKHDIGQAEQTLEQMCGGSGIVMTAVDSSPSSGYHRKRSLSVPLLFSMNQEPGENGVAGSASAATGAGAGARAAGEDGTSPNEDGDGDQDMEADDEQEDHSHDNTLDSTDSNAATAPLPTMSLSSSSSTALVLDYSALTLPRESLLATVPRSHRHRIFAAGHHHLHHHHQQQQQQQQQQHQHPHHPLYYNAHDYHHTNNNSHHNHYTLRHHLHYNPFTYRKFPPYQYWAASAQRDYHLATIGVGVVGRASGQHSRLPIRRSAAAILGLPSDSDSAAGSTFAGTGDLVLRSSSSAANGGGISKSNMFRSRLPVHLRHITSRANRRAAIYVNPYQPGGDVVDRRIRDTGRVEGSESGLGSGSATDEILMSSLSIEDDTTDSRSRALMPAASFSPSDAAASDTSSRRKLTDWKRVTAFKLDLEDSETHQRSGAVVRLGSHDLVTSKASSSLSTLSTSASAVSHGSGDASIVRSSGNGKQWMSQRGGLANLLQFSHRGSGSSKASAATNTVDRLVEEMNKWSV